LKAAGARPPLNALELVQCAPQNVTCWPTTALRSPITKLTIGADGVGVGVGVGVAVAVAVGVGVAVAVAVGVGVAVAVGVGVGVGDEQAPVCRV